ncbi:hypothetical protein C8J57DRAFT_1590463 [Mycena rebaudengoi]|nr:hypothetical protein C8J57DRAFT_1590463 [Mycena rebaudengoi]
MPLTKRRRIVHNLLLLSLPPLCIAYNQTHFELYKNTHFGPCPPKAPRNATVPVADQGYPLLNNASLSAAAFCDRFWNYTVLPTMPEDGAFRLSWVNVVINIVVGVISAVSMFMLAVTADDAYNRPAFLERLQHIGRTFWSRLPCTTGSQSIARHPAARPTVGRSFFSATIHHGANLFKTAWRPLTQLDTYKKIWWWTPCYGGIRSSRSPDIRPPRTPCCPPYFVSLHDDLTTERYKVVGPLIVVAVLLQQAAAAAALVLFYRSHGPAPQYTVVHAFDLAQFNCDVPAILRDPTNTTYLVSVGASPALLVYAFFVVGFFVYYASHRFSRKYVARFLMCLYAFQVTYSLISLVFVLQPGMDPIAWDPHCRLVHVMMGCGYGYLDIQVPYAVRSVRTFFTLQTVKTLFNVKW